MQVTSPTQTQLAVAMALCLFSLRCVSTSSSEAKAGTPATARGGATHAGQKNGAANLEGIAGKDGASGRNGGGSGGTAITGTARPKIVFILADDLGYGDVSALNPDSLLKTPRIDALASQARHSTRDGR